MKKIISTSSIFLITGISIYSSVSALSTEMDNENTSATGTISSSEAPVPTLYGTNENNPQQDIYSQCLAYVKFKNLTGVDCKAKIQTLQQGIKNDRAQMNQKINDDKMKMQQENVQNREMMGSGMIKPPIGTGELKSFLRNPLTSEEQTALKSLLQTQQTERDTIIKDTTLTPVEKEVKMKELMTTHMTALLSYISTDKQDAFKKMIVDQVAMMQKNQDLRQENKDNQQKFKDGVKEQRQEFKKEVQAKKQALSENLHTQLTAAIEKLPVEKLNRVIANIEKAVTKITSSSLTQEKKDNFLAQLEEIKGLIQDKIDTLSGTTSGINLNEILNGTGPADTGTGTTTTSGTVTQ
jgi:hypothetical protein